MNVQTPRQGERFSGVVRHRAARGNLSTRCSASAGTVSGVWSSFPGPGDGHAPVCFNNTVADDS